MLRLVVIVAGMLAAPISLACPIFLSLMDTSGLIGPRRLTHLFATDGGKWRELPLDIQPLDDSERPRFFLKGQDWQSDRLSGRDRLVFYDEAFGGKHLKGQDWPCATSAMVQVRPAGTDRYGYLAVCQGGTNVAKAGNWAPIRHTPADREVEGAFYRYAYSKANHLMFQSFVLAPKAPGGGVLFSEESDELIRGDLKRFFVLEFDSDSVEAVIREERVGTVGLIGRLNFFLRILFFKLQLKLVSDVSFYPDAIFLPMTMYLPVDAPDYLHPMSGVFYTFRPGKAVEWDYGNSRVPGFDRALINQGVAHLAKLGLDRCQAEVCRYQLRGKVGERAVSLEFAIARRLVERGFFPMVFNSSDVVEKDLGFRTSRFSPPGRMGFYFETSGLPTGGHDWQFWMRFADKSAALTEACPRSVTPNTIVR